jgi:CHAT domain-containing protein
LVGLTRGFMYAGAALVVVSLWSVSDRATSELMARFYEKMLKDRQRPLTRRICRSAAQLRCRCGQAKHPAHISGRRERRPASRRSE